MESANTHEVDAHEAKKREGRRTKKPMTPVAASSLLNVIARASRAGGSAKQSGLIGAALGSEWNTLLTSGKRQRVIAGRYYSTDSVGRFLHCKQCIRFLNADRPAARRNLNVNYFISGADVSWRDAKIFSGEEECVSGDRILARMEVLDCSGRGNGGERTP